MTRVGIVGAGAAAAAATYVLDGTTEATVTVLEKSGGLCGRAATRRRGPVTYDYGANYLKDDDDRVVELVTGDLDDDGLVEIAEPTYTFDREGTVTEGREPSGRRWSYRRGLTQIAKRLFARTDATVHRHTRVEELRHHPGDPGDDDPPDDGDDNPPDDGGHVDGADDGHADGHDGDDAGRRGVTGTGTWTLLDDDGEEWGPFDAVLLNPPAPQTAALVRESDWAADAREELAAAAGDVDYRAVWTAVLGYGFDLDRPYYALINTDGEHALSWLSRESCKAGHVPEGEVLIAQANHDWSVAHYDDDPAANVAALADAAAELVGDGRLRDPDWTDHQGWRYALPEAGALAGPLRAAEDHGLYCAGDWVAGEARLHAALRNGLDVGERLAYAL